MDQKIGCTLNKKKNIVEEFISFCYGDVRFTGKNKDNKLNCFFWNVALCEYLMLKLIIEKF